MNTKITVALISVIVLLTALAAYTSSPFSISQTNSPARDTQYIVDGSDMYTAPARVLSASPLTEQEIEWLRHMREEEKLARDVYTTLGDMWGVQIFSNIAASEQTHTDAVRSLLKQYSIRDTTTDDTVGIFTLPEMKQLYTDLVAQGSRPELDALIVGATIEDLDIHDLDTALSVTTNPDISTVYKNLQKGSRNHLRAFIKNIESRGGTYAPQHITLEAFTTILATPQEKGRVN